MTSSRALEHEFAIRGPWASQFVIDGETYGGDLCYDDDERIAFFRDSFPGVHSVLDLGSLEGAHSFALAAMPGVRVLGIDGRASNVEKARFVQSALGVDNVSFAQANVEASSLLQFGDFDAVFCSGLLYHLSEPWRCLEQIAAITSRLFIWTHYAASTATAEAKDGFQGFHYQEGGLDDPLSGLSASSFMLTLQSLHDALRQHGFAHVRMLEDKVTPPMFVPSLQREICGWPEATISAWKGDPMEQRQT